MASDFRRSDDHFIENFRSYVFWRSDLFPFYLHFKFFTQTNHLKFEERWQYVGFIFLLLLSFTSTRITNFLLRFRFRKCWRAVIKKIHSIKISVQTLELQGGPWGFGPILLRGYCGWVARKFRGPLFSCLIPFVWPSFQVYHPPAPPPPCVHLWVRITILSLVFVFQK